MKFGRLERNGDMEVGKNIFFMGNIKNKYYKPLKKYASSPKIRFSVQEDLFSMKKIFLLISNQKGSMTVEATVILPLFLFFFLYLSSAISMLHYHGIIQYSLWKTGKQLSLYTAAGDNLNIRLPDIATTQLWAYLNLVEEIGEERLENSPIRFGKYGLNFFQLEKAREEDSIQITVTYQVTPPFSLFPFPYRRMANQYYGRVWTGYDVSANEETVFVTEYGQVWHTSKECAYLDSKLKWVPLSAVQNVRNEDGKKYSKCEICGNAASGIVYITEYGERYHSNITCKTLVRRVREIPSSEKGTYRPCSKCAK